MGGVGGWKQTRSKKLKKKSDKKTNDKKKPISVETVMIL